MPLYAATLMRFSRHHSNHDTVAAIIFLFDAICYAATPAFAMRRDLLYAIIFDAVAFQIAFAYDVIFALRFSRHYYARHALPFRRLLYAADFCFSPSMPCTLR